MPHVSGKNGAVYKGAEATLRIDDCDIIWTAGVASVTLETTNPPEGTGYARASTSTIGADQILILHAITKDLANYDGAYWRARTNLSGGTTATKLKLNMYETGNEASPDLELIIPALTQDVWKQCFDLFEGATGVRDAIVGVQLYQVTDLDDATFDLDDIVALAEIDGIRTWNLEYSSDMLETTDFANVGISAFIPGKTQWSGSFEGFKEGIPLGIGAEVYLVMGETNSDGNWWLGKAIITAARPVVDNDGLVSYSYDFQGTGALETPST